MCGLAEQGLGDGVPFALHADAAASEGGLADGVEAFDAVAGFVEHRVVGGRIDEQ